MLTEFHPPAVCRAAKQQPVLPRATSSLHTGPECLQGWGTRSPPGQLLLLTQQDPQLLLCSAALQKITLQSVPIGGTAPTQRSTPHVALLNLLRFPWPHFPSLPRPSELLRVPSMPSSATDGDVWGAHVWGRGVGMQAGMGSAAPYGGGGTQRFGGRNGGGWGDECSPHCCSAPPARSAARQLPVPTEPHGNKATQPQCSEPGAAHSKHTQHFWHHREVQPVGKPPHPTPPQQQTLVEQTRPQRPNGETKRGAVPNISARIGSVCKAASSSLHGKGPSVQGAALLRHSVICRGRTGIPRAGSTRPTCREHRCCGHRAVRSAPWPSGWGCCRDGLCCGFGDGSAELRGAEGHCRAEARGFVTSW